MPLMYPPYQDNPAYRKMTVGDYLVFYKVNEGARTVEVYRILRRSWDIPPRLG